MITVLHALCQSKAFFLFYGNPPQKSTYKHVSAKQSNGSIAYTNILAVRSPFITKVSKKQENATG